MTTTRPATVAWLLACVFALAACLAVSLLTGCDAHRAEAQNPAVTGTASELDADGEGDGDDTAAGTAASPMLARLDAEMTAVAERARQSVVKISARTRVPLPYPEALPEGSPPEVVVPVTYSGIVVRASGFVVTVADAVERGQIFRLLLPDGRYRAATVWARDVASNLAVLRVSLTEEDDEQSLMPIRFADSDAVRPGQFALACGNPFGLTRSISTGIVTGVDRTVVIDGDPWFGVIQTNAAINPGDPGGACVDASGACIGMIWSTYGRSRFTPTADGSESGMLRDMLDGMFGGQESPDATGPIDADDFQRAWKQRVNRMYAETAAGGEDQVHLGAQGINFVLPANFVSHITDELIEHRRVRRGTLGVQLRSLSGANGVQRVIVLDVQRDSAAASAGLARGDVLARVNNVPIGSLADMQRAMQIAAPGDVVVITYLRNGTATTVRARLGGDIGANSDGADPDREEIDDRD